MYANTQSPKKNEFNEKTKVWFDKLIGSIRADQIMLETNTASPEKTKMYNSLILGQDEETFKMSRASSTMYFIKNMILDYLNAFKEYNSRPLKLAVELSDAKILVWAEIKDNDDETEDTLLLAEAKTNAKYSEFGFHISSTIVEECDKTSIPSHYQNIIS